MRRLLAVAAVTLMTACTTVPASTAAPPTAPANAVSASAAASPAWPSQTVPPPPLTFQTSAAQARMVATIVAFLDAYNAGRVEDALVLLSADVSISDCDYRAVSVITANGREAARQWLTERAADNDQMVLRSIANENPDPVTGSHVVGVGFSRRTSDTLRSLGFPNGVSPHGFAKVVFTSTDFKVRGFANGPLGGPAELCRPNL